MTSAISARDAGELVIFIAAVITALGVIVRSKPVRWLWRRNVVDPGSDRLRQVVAEVVDERLDARPLTNGAGRDTVKAIGEHLGIDVPDDG